MVYEVGSQFSKYQYLKRRLSGTYFIRISYFWSTYIFWKHYLL